MIEQISTEEDFVGQLEGGVDEPEAEQLSAGAPT
jgi:hypothetical protein